MVRTQNVYTTQSAHDQRKMYATPFHPLKIWAPFGLRWELKSETTISSFATFLLLFIRTSLHRFSRNFPREQR